MDPKGIMNPKLMHSTKKTPEEQKEYNNYVAQQIQISRSFKNISKKLKERNENPALRSLLLSAMSEINPKTRNDKLKVYFNMINNPNKYNKSKKHQRNRSNSNSNNSNNSNSNKSAKSAKRHKLNPKKL